MSARAVKRRREGWVREGIVYEYIAAVPAKRAAVESKSVFSHRNRIGNALTIYGLDFYGSRRERRRLATLSSARPNASGRGSTTHSSGRDRRCVCPTSRRRRSRVGCVSRWGRWRSEACVGGTRRPRRLFAETGTSENTSPSSRTPSRAPRAGASSCRTPAGPEPPRARPDDAESSRSAPRGSSSGRRVRARAPPPRAPQGGRGCEGVSRHRRHADARPKVLTRAEF